MTRANKLPPQTEASFQKQVITLARLHGWRVAHFRPARTAKGWRTPCQADAKGFPDLLMTRGAVCIVAELKVGGKVSAAQAGWLTAFADAEIPAYVWTPDSWGQIEAVLRDGPQEFYLDDIRRTLSGGRP